MSRKLCASIHLYLAAFYSSVVIVMAVSGGWYLLDYEGEVTRTEIGHVAGAQLDDTSQTLSSDAVAVLAALSIRTRVEEVRVRGDDFYTRPSSRQNYTLRQTESGVDVEVAIPLSVLCFYYFG